MNVRKVNRVVPMLACSLVQSAHVSTLSRILDAHARLSDDISDSATYVLMHHPHSIPSIRTIFWVVSCLLLSLDLVGGLLDVLPVTIC